MAGSPGAHAIAPKLEGHVLFALAPKLEGHVLFTAAIELHVRAVLCSSVPSSSESQCTATDSGLEMGGGHFCCMVACSACQTENRGLSFFKIPRASENNLEWRQRLIAVINRADSSFNPDKAYICSRHFEEECFTAHGKF